MKILLINHYIKRCTIQYEERVIYEKLSLNVSFEFTFSTNIPSHSSNTFSIKGAKWAWCVYTDNGGSCRC